MLKKISLLIITIICFCGVYAQNNVNNFKYVIVPNEYDFQHEPDEYQLNSISEFLFNKYGFTAIMQDDEFPEDLEKNGCLALRADVIKDKGVFTTKLHIILKNCSDQVIFEGANGESREKQYKVAYNYALREAFLYVKALNYKYEPVKEEAVITKNNENAEVQQVPITTAVIATDVAVEMVSETEVAPNNPKSSTSVADSEVLYAQAINNGYQLVDSTPKVVYVLIFSGKKDFYMVKGIDATVYKLNGNWVIAQTVGDDIQVKVLNIKF